MPIKSFRGLMGNGELETIPLQTNNGLTGYRVVKFQLFPHDVDGSASMEDLVQIWKTSAAASTATVDCDFSNNQLLGAGYYVRSLNSSAPYVATIAEAQTIFDNEVFNQDIYVTMNTGQTGSKINYYIELEQINLSLDEATVATLKDIRNTGSQ
jgi:hypothetical protein